MRRHHKHSGVGLGGFLLALFLLPALAAFVPILAFVAAFLILGVGVAKCVSPYHAAREYKPHKRH